MRNGRQRQCFEPCVAYRIIEKAYGAEWWQQLELSKARR